MSDYKIDAATKEEWALRAWSAEAKLAEAQARIEALEDRLQAAIDDAKEAEAYAAEMEGGVANG